MGRDLSSPNSGRTGSSFGMPGVYTDRGIGKWINMEKVKSKKDHGNLLMKPTFFFQIRENKSTQGLNDLLINKSHTNEPNTQRFFANANIYVITYILYIFKIWSTEAQ